MNFLLAKAQKKLIHSLEEDRKFKELAPWGQVIETSRTIKRISQCPCCLTKNAEILLEEEDEDQKRLSEMEKDLKAREDFFKRLSVISQ